jgi:hypothetical protein
MNLKLLPSAILFISLYLMPGWIALVGRTSWPILTKRIFMALLVIVFILYSAIVIAKPNPDQTTRIIGNVVTILYLLFVIVTAYYHWPR